jgi:hypothetical protein
MRPSKLSRRQFLRGGSGFLLGIPFLPSLCSAIGSPEFFAAKRLVLLPFEFGGWTSLMAPTMKEAIPFFQEFSESIRCAKLSELPKPLSLYFDEDYNEFVDQLNIFKGMQATIDGPHTYGIFAGSGHNLTPEEDSSNRKPTHGKTIDVIIE